MALPADLATPQEADGSGAPDDAALDRLNALGNSLAKTKKEAIEGRLASGIEDIWREDEEHYEGIDDLNRNNNKKNWQSKPPGQSFPGVPDNQSTEFVNITRPYVDAAAAKVGDILLPTDDRSWSLTETPVPELIELSKGGAPLSQDVVDGIKGVVAPEHQPAVLDQVAAQEAQAKAQKAAQLLAEARATAEKAQKRIEDWHIEGQFHGEVRKVIEDCCRIGSGVLKGPIPQNKRSVMYKDGALVIDSEIKPVSKRIDPWNFYPDPACGESIHRGNYVWEHDNITAKVLESLKADPEYLSSQIDLCLEEGPKHSDDTGRKTAEGKEVNQKSLYDIWYYNGQVKREDLEAAGCECNEKTPASVSAIVTMVNERVIKIALNPLDTGEFPYDLMPWQRKKNMPWGSGVARQIRTPQRMVVAGTRTLLTNCGRAAGPLIIRKMGAVLPLDGSEDMTPWKQFGVKDDDSTDDVRKAMAMIQIPDLRESLMAVIQFGLKMAEDVTGLPLLLQGQAGSAPETLGGQQLVDRNASTTLRRIARTFDDYITEPHIRRYYAWLLQYGEDDEKGEFQIDARGSQALVDREMYRGRMEQMLQASLNPAFGLNPEKFMTELLRVEKLRPEDLQFTDQEKQERAKQGQQPSERVQVAQITSASAEKIADKELQAKAAMQDGEQKHESQEKAQDRQLALVVQTITERIEAMKLTGAKEISFEQLKAELAEVSMKLATTKDLELADKMTDIHKHGLPQGHRVPPPVITPPVEPPGRAQPGHSFEQ